MTAEERAAKVEALTTRLTAAVADLTEGEQWTAMLRASARFHRYSFRNMMLLSAQADERGMSLSAVAGFKTWRDLGRSIRKGEHGFAILAPLKRRAEAIDDAAVAAGQVMVGVRIVHVFDVSQTNGADLPDLPRPAAPTGAAVPELWDALAGLVRADGYDLQRQPANDPEEQGWTDHRKRVVSVRPDIDDAYAAAILAHELGHIRADHHHRQISRAQKETEAESIAYVVMGIHGLDSAASAAPYVAGWSEGDQEVIAAAAETVHTVAAGIIADLTPPEPSEASTAAAPARAAVTRPQRTARVSSQPVTAGLTS